MDTCVCCGKPVNANAPRVDRGKIHFGCWDEHHSDPSGTPWPADHQCAVPRDAS